MSYYILPDQLQDVQNDNELCALAIKWKHALSQGEASGEGALT